MNSQSKFVFVAEVQVDVKLILTFPPEAEDASKNTNDSSFTACTFYKRWFMFSHISYPDLTTTIAYLKF